jgi:hypothetical protein
VPDGAPAGAYLQPARPSRPKLTPHANAALSQPLQLRERLDQYTGKRRERKDYNLVEVIGGSQPMTVEN